MNKLKLCAFADEASDQFEEQIDALSENDIEYLEARGIDGENISDITLLRADEIRKRLEGNGLGVWSIGSPIGKIEIADDFEAHLDKFKYTVDVARTIGAKCIRLFSFYMDSHQAEDYREMVVERLNAFAAASEGSGILLCHENEKGIYGDIPERCADICRTIPGIKAVFDPANFVQCGRNPLEAWELMKPFVAYLHIKDAVYGGKNVPAGEGDGCIAEILKRYIQIGGNIVSLEPHLWEFSGLAVLEREGERSLIAGHYQSQRQAFDVGVKSLKNILAESKM